MSFIATTDMYIEMRNKRDLVEDKLHDMTKQRNSLIDDLAVSKANISRLERELAAALNGELATYDELQKYVLELQSDLMEYQKENEQLNNVADEAMGLVESENSKVLKLEHENKALRLQADTYFDEWQTVKNLYTTLTNHIRLKAEINPSVDRYIDLVNYIDRLERD